MTSDAPDLWDASIPPGGYVCSICGTPVESEPCRDHQPRAYAAMDTTPTTEENPAMPENTTALSPEQLPEKITPHYAAPGTVYDDEPGALVPPGWYVLGDHGHGEGADIEIKIEHAVDANGNDVSGPLAAKIASLLAAFATKSHDEPAPRVPQPGDRPGWTFTVEEIDLHPEKDTEPAPRVPQPGDRVFGWAGRPFGTVHGFVVADELTNAAGFIAVKAPGVSAPYSVDPATVEVIEPAPADGYRHHTLSDCPDEQACPVHGLSPTVPDDPAREDTPTPACTDMGCTRIGGRCVGYHCPHCGQPTGMAGHRCREDGQKPTGQQAFGLLALGDQDGARTVLAAADLKTLFTIGDISHALNELVAEVLRSRPADTGKEADR